MRALAWEARCPHAVRGDSSCIKHFSRHSFSKGLQLRCANPPQVSITVERYKDSLGHRKKALWTCLWRRDIKLKIGYTKEKYCRKQGAAARIMQHTCGSSESPGYVQACRWEHPHAPPPEVFGRTLLQVSLMWSLTLWNQVIFFICFLGSKKTWAGWWHWTS